MQVYSKKIVSFIMELKGVIRDILSREVRLKVHGDRFYDRRGECSYPIKVVIYNNSNTLGYFLPGFYELGFHEQLMHMKKEAVRNIIRHELAHYMVFTTYGKFVEPHGNEFKAFCQSMGWSDQVSKASIGLENSTNYKDGFVQESSVLRKVQKLMALASSTNKNEAEQAMIKSQQLLLKHNVDSSFISSEDDEKVFLKRILKEPKKSAKMQAIALILQTFFVSVVYNRESDNYTHLEIIGNAVNIEVADYVSGFLQHQLDAFWDSARTEHKSLKGMVAKNSFFLGIARGYCEKVNCLKRTCDYNMSNALMVIENKLMESTAMVYPRLRSTRSNRQHCHDSYTLGELQGRSLTINPAVTKANTSDAFITYASK